MQAVLSKVCKDLKLIVLIDNSGFLVNMTNDSVLIPAGTILGGFGSSSNRRHCSEQEELQGETTDGKPIVVVDWHRKMSAHRGPCSLDGNAPNIPVFYGKPPAPPVPTYLIKLLKACRDGKSEDAGRYGLRFFKVDGAWPNWSIEPGKKGPVCFTLEVPTLIR